MQHIKFSSTFFYSRFREITVIVGLDNFKTFSLINQFIFLFQQLENVVTEKISEIISARSEIGDLRRKVDSYEQENERWKKKQQLLQKMCMDLNTVMKRYIVDKQNSTKDKVAPIKITRSVGLQVS